MREHSRARAVRRTLKGVGSRGRRYGRNSGLRKIIAKKAAFCCLSALCLFFLGQSVCEAGLTVYDLIAPRGEAVMLKAQAKGRLFPLGGVLVDFFVNGEKIGTNLSGGDGYVFLEFHPGRNGVHRVSAVHREMSAQGTLLVLNRGADVVFVDVMGSMMNGPLGEPREGCREQLEMIMRKYPVVFLSTGLAPPSMLKKWLGENQFEEAALVSWAAGAVFAEAVQKGFRIRAVIGSPQVVESARDYARDLYSFEDVQGAARVRKWSEIGEKMR